MATVALRSGASAKKQAPRLQIVERTAGPQKGQMPSPLEGNRWADAGPLALKVWIAPQEFPRPGALGQRIRVVIRIEAMPGRFIMDWGTTGHRGLPRSMARQTAGRRPQVSCRRTRLAGLTSLRCDERDLGHGQRDRRPQNRPLETTLATQAAEGLMGDLEVARDGLGGADRVRDSNSS